MPLGRGGPVAPPFVCPARGRRGTGAGVRGPHRCRSPQLPPPSPRGATVRVRTRPRPRPRRRPWAPPPRSPRALAEPRPHASRPRKPPGPGHVAAGLATVMDRSHQKGLGPSGASSISTKDFDTAAPPQGAPPPAPPATATTTTTPTSESEGFLTSFDRRYPSSRPTLSGPKGNDFSARTGFDNKNTERPVHYLSPRPRPSGRGGKVGGLGTTHPPPQGWTFRPLRPSECRAFCSHCVGEGGAGGEAEDHGKRDSSPPLPGADHPETL